MNENKNRKFLFYYFDKLHHHELFSFSFSFMLRSQRFLSLSTLLLHKRTTMERKKCKTISSAISSLISYLHFWFHFFHGNKFYDFTCRVATGILSMLHIFLLCYLFFCVLHKRIVPIKEYLGDRLFALVWVAWSVNS